MGCKKVVPPRSAAGAGAPDFSFALFVCIAIFIGGSNFSPDLSDNRIVGNKSPDPITAYSFVQWPSIDEGTPPGFLLFRTQCAPVAGETGGFTVVEEEFQDDGVDGTLDDYRRNEGTVSSCTLAPNIRAIRLLLLNAPVTHPRTLQMTGQSARSFTDRFRTVKAEAFAEFRTLADTIATTATSIQCIGSDKSAAVYLGTESHGLRIDVQIGEKPWLTGVAIEHKAHYPDNEPRLSANLSSDYPHTPQPKNAADYQHFLEIYQQTCSGRTPD